MPTLQYLIQKYFPPSEWDRAACISNAECSQNRENYPQSCIADEGLIDCAGPSPVYAKSWGPFQILDACWSPYLNPSSPFTREQWDKVLDLEYNTWMASVIWSISGWSAWTTCGTCAACDVPGGAIPYPSGPALPEQPPYEIIPQPGEQVVSSAPLVIIGLGLLAGAVVVMGKGARR